MSTLVEYTQAGVDKLQAFLERTNHRMGGLEEWHSPRHKRNFLLFANDDVAVEFNMVVSGTTLMKHQMLWHQKMKVISGRNFIYAVPKPVTDAFRYDPDRSPWGVAVRNVRQQRETAEHEARIEDTKREKERIIAEFEALEARVKGMV